MAARVTWLGRASDRVQSDLVSLFTADLQAAFPEASGIAVYDCFKGFSQDQVKKVVLGVEVRTRKSYHTHIVKLGEGCAVCDDYDGWQKCVLKHNFASHIFFSLAKRELPGNRSAIIYQDAYRMFGSLDESQGPQFLETVAFWAIKDDKPDPISVERVIRQVYTDLYRWFYRSANVDPGVALRFYKRRLSRALDKWTSDAWRKELRRDLIWLLCSHDVPDSVRNMAYLDPCDYVGWCLKHEHLPRTLVGRSHGDLHGRNVLVGVQRGEAEYPAVFDYGEMSDSNVLVWDFVKLECELKVRILLTLYEDVAARRRLFELESADALIDYGGAQIDRPSAEMDPRSLRAQQLAFGFKFESVLAALTERIHRLDEPEAPHPPGGRKITGNQNVDRALGILLRIRQEAALLLGERQPQRGKRDEWRDEYFFALAVYGLSTAKFDYKETESGFALVSSGVALAHTRMATKDITSQISAGKLVKVSARMRYPYPSYRVPLAMAHHMWKHRGGDNIDKAVELLGAARPHYDHAVPLLQNYVLLLAEAGRSSEALKMLGPLEDICSVFRDSETLCRIGRMCKDLGDEALDLQYVPYSSFGNHSARQWYKAAQKRYSEAFDMSREYYPGVNAATLALLSGDHEESHRLAAEVLKVCRGFDLSCMHVEDCFWVRVTEGEANLLLRRRKRSMTCYQEALGILDEDHRGMAQSVYNQVCRLAWSLGSPASAVLAVFRNGPFKLTPGPLHDGQIAQGAKPATRRRPRGSTGSPEAAAPRL